MRQAEAIKPPTRRELFTLRLMIILGLACMFFFMKSLLATDIVEFAPLYWMLITAMVFTCLKVIHEWIHYFYITVPKLPAGDKQFNVDIFTTYVAGEPYDMIVETLTAIQKITYPHQTYLCDEANDPYLIAVCRQLGVTHVTRTLKIDAKAGNINNALKQATGELCVILDPDHVPFPGFLDPIVAHFNNPEIGFVQIVQAYRNQYHSLVSKGAAQQTFQFYGPIMMTMNRYGTVLAIGANCTFRRAALDSIGGHAAGLAEDMHTAMQLHARGWKSVYVPAILARGFVPFTLSAYYKQQLKWSRGVFELLFTSYPKLFSKFTWQQKLHYGVIPLHYLSGILFLINFLIPIISLVFDVSPVNIALSSFVIMGLPFVLAIILIRHFVQFWVTEDDERGFHVVGGLLMIGTWWVYIMGLICTLIRRDIPYIPTNKDGTEDDNFLINIPNILVILLSLFAITYGLRHDWSPYTLIMAGFAGLNCLILSFSVIASRQHQFRKIRKQATSINAVMGYWAEFKGHFWLLRRRIYAGIRRTALFITLFIACVILYTINQRRRHYDEPTQKQYAAGNMVAGIFAPTETNGLTDIKLAKQYEQQGNVHFGIISLYLSWGDQKQCELPVSLLDSIYQNGSIPMITWEPWQSLFNKNKTVNPSDKEKKVFSRIVAGDYDEYLFTFCRQLKSLKRPVYLRFAHEADNPFYPWSTAGGNTPDEFKAAWIYVHNYFKHSQADNVIWVWNPWKPEAIADYFPGSENVDWLAVTLLNYGSKSGSTAWYPMEELYNPFHDDPVFTSGLPVMMAEMGSLKSEGRQDEWFSGAVNSIKVKFPEIKAIVLFNSGVDKNTLELKPATLYDWRFSNLNILQPLLKESNYPTVVESVLLADSASGSAVAVNGHQNNTLQNVIGINYTKGKNWSENFKVFNMRVLLNDFAAIEKAGFNTIKWYGPGIYDRNVLKVAKQQNIKLTYSFWIGDDRDFMEDDDELTNKIVHTIANLKGNKDIISWNIGNSSYQNLGLRYYKPDLFNQQVAYITWLHKLVIAIKKADPSRPLSIDIEATDDVLKITSLILRAVPQIDAFGLVINEKSTGVDSISKLTVPWFYSKVDAHDYLKLPARQPGFFISNWQDEETASFVTFDGLTDKWGRNKYELYEIGHRLKGLDLPTQLPEVKILLPALTTFANTSLTYHALLLKNDEWKLASNADGLKFVWELVKNDQFGNPLSTKALGSGPAVTFNIPNEPAYYSLCLYISRGNQVKVIKSKLNTPLVN